MEKSSLINRNLGDSDRFKYSENTNTCVMTCSGNLRSIGVVLNTNSEITRLLQYSASELIGRNISQIMPNIIADIHNDLMMNYFTTAKETSIGKEVDIFPLNKSSYLVPCTISTKVFPNLNEGIKIVAFLRNVESHHKPAKSFEENLWNSKV